MEAEEWFAATLPDLSEATDWRMRKADLHAAAARTGNNAPGSDAGADWLVDAVFEVLRALGRGSGDGGPSAFGASYMTLIPKGDFGRIRGSVSGRWGALGPSRWGTPTRGSMRWA